MADGRMACGPGIRTLRAASGRRDGGQRARRSGRGHSPPFRDALDAAVEGGDEPVVADLTGVTFIDSTGLGVLIGTRRRCLDAGRELRIVVADPRILKVFEITGLTDLFIIHPALEPAIRG